MNTLSTSNIRWEMRIVISMCLGYGMLMLCRTVVGVAGPAMLADPMLTLDTATFGAILGWGTAGNLTGKLTTGVLADKLGGSKVFIWAVGLAAIATFIFGSLSSNFAFFALYFLTVSAKSAGWPSMANIIRVSFIQAKHGRVWGFIATSSRISSVATTLLVSSLLFIMSWRGLFYMAGVLALVSAIILARYLKSSMQDSEKLSADVEGPAETIASWSKEHPLSKTETHAAIRIFISNPRFWLISLGVSSLAVLFEFQVFLPIYLSETFSLMPAQAGMASSAFPLGCLVAVFSGGFIYDKLSKKNIVYTMSANLIGAVLCLLGLRLLGVYDFGSGLELALIDSFDIYFCIFYLARILHSNECLFDRFWWQALRFTCWLNRCVCLLWRNDVRFHWWRCSEQGRGMGGFHPHTDCDLYAGDNYYDDIPLFRLPRLRTRSRFGPTILR